ncbi:hypothetical protein [Thermomonospora umbrina]|uniref:hypothetical protein n=1 Tax=Thermomonospora umbrina TaxID=111806 RepID=UPI0011C17C4D|nr:hypothetical protein [Thermomonospora umbrina]
MLYPESFLREIRRLDPFTQVADGITPITNGREACLLRAGHVDVTHVAVHHLRRQVTHSANTRFVVMDKNRHVAREYMVRVSDTVCGMHGGFLFVPTPSKQSRCKTRPWGQNLQASRRAL